MSELLSAASMYLAFISLLYSTWYSETKKTLSEKEKSYNAEDNRMIVDKVTNVKRYRVEPLLIASIMLSVLLIPEVIRIASNIMQFICSDSRSFFDDYRAVDALLLTIVLGAISMGIHLWNIRMGLIEKVNELSKDK